MIVYCTCPDPATASTIARALVEERLAACVSRLPAVRSTYRWQGGIQEDEEVLLLIKSSHARLDALTSRLRELHPYDLPEVLAVAAAGGLAPYLQWVEDEVGH